LVSDLSGSPHIYRGNLTTAMAEPTYSSQIDGTGAIVSDAARELVIGNRHATNTNAYQGQLAVVALYDSALTLAECEKWRLRPSRNIKAGCLGFWILGNNGSTGTQTDLTGNGNDGTVTGATAAATQIPLALHGRLVGHANASRPLVGRGLCG
jgi:hypothetical protein